MLCEDDTFLQLIPQNTYFKYKNIYFKNLEHTIYASTNHLA